MIRFDKITPRLPVNDIRSTVEFYRQVLECETSMLCRADEPEFAIVNRDTISVGFYKVGSPGRPQESVGQGELYIETNDADGLHGQLRNRVKIEWGPEIYPHGRKEFAIRDPNGYLIIFTEKTAEPPTVDDP